MRVAGMGFREGASIASLRDALMRAKGENDIHALATITGKSDAPPLRALATELGVPVRAIAPEAVVGVVTSTQSPRMIARFGTGSLAEAAALLTAGPDALLISPRVISFDGMASAAVAESFAA